MPFILVNCRRQARLRRATLSVSSPPTPGPAPHAPPPIAPADPPAPPALHPTPSQRDDYAALAALGYTPVGLSTDLPKAQLSWKTSKRFPYPLLSDPKRVLLNRLGSTQAKK